MGGYKLDKTGISDISSYEVQYLILLKLTCEPYKSFVQQIYGCSSTEYIQGWAKKLNGLFYFVYSLKEKEDSLLAQNI